MAASPSTAEAFTMAGLCSALGGVMLWWAGKETGQKAEKFRSVEQPLNISVMGKWWRETPLHVSIRGRVGSDEPLVGRVSGKKAAIVKIDESQVIEKKLARKETTSSTTHAQHTSADGRRTTETTTTRSSTSNGAQDILGTLFDWVPYHKTLESHVQEAPWALRDGSGAELPIDGGLEPAKGGGLLSSTGDRLIPSNQGGRDRLAEEELGERHLGVRRALRRDGHMLVLRPEILTRKPLQQLIDEAQEAAAACNFGAKLCLVLAGSLLVGAAVAHYKESRGGRRP